jgi:hypothetical protein
MPFELGVFHGAKHFGRQSHARKVCLVLEKTSYRYQKFLSDLAGMDITPHHNSQRKLIIAVRNWLVTASRRKNIPNGESIDRRFRSFQAFMRRSCRARSTDYDAMPFVELLDNITDWLKTNQTLGAHAL